ncbi:hypothetical protein LXA43DRAFT_358848 [Ganoderma leucocontextum]|nr:hypothetical protein LXA43DRAFT_358848 [Ganoderma leucocontextum]
MMTKSTEAKSPKSVDISDASSVDTKIEESFDASNERFERVRSLWFEDGNVVIVAQESGFRVHKSVLSRHSSVFVKILNDSNDSDALLDQLGIVIDADNKIEGSVVIHVSDSTHDFGHLLRIFYDGFDYLKHTRSDDFADLAAATRLAHKYTVSVVLSEATLRLQQLFPPTFDIWEATEDVRVAAERVRPQDAVEAVNLFRTLGSAGKADDMLPIALYLCCQLAPGELLRGHHRADGTLERLSIDDVELCWKLRETLSEKAAEMTEQLYRRVAGSADAEKKKCKCFNAFEKSVPWKSLKEARGGDPLGRMLRDGIEAEKEKGFKLCDKCLSTLRELEKTVRGEFWEELHRDYGRAQDEQQ